MRKHKSRYARLTWAIIDLRRTSRRKERLFREWKTEQVLWKKERLWQRFEVATEEFIRCKEFFAGPGQRRRKQNNGF